MEEFLEEFYEEWDGRAWKRVLFLDFFCMFR